MTLRSVFVVLSLTAGLCACSSLTKMMEPAPPKPPPPPTQPVSPPPVETAKERVVLASAAGVICAEPDTALLAAFRGVSGEGASTPDKVQGPVSPALRDAAVAAVLKTQWSTLMRDQLYRICEAYYNKAIGGPQVMELLLRSQDIAFATAALEHLTQAVTLSSRSEASTGAGGAPSSGVTQLQILLVMTKRDQQAKSQVVQADTETLAKQTAALEQAQAAASNAEKDKRVSDEEKKQLAAAVVQAKAGQAAAAQNLKLAQDLADAATKTTQAIENGLEVALAEAKATPAPAPTATPPSQASAGDQMAIAQVAIAVKEIVQTAVNRDYLSQGCFTLLTTESNSQLSPEQAKAREDQVKFCMGIIQSGLPH